MLKSYAPPVVGQIKEIAAIWDAIEPEFVLLMEEMKKIQRLRDPNTADEQGIKRFEKLYGIMPSPNSSIEERRSTIKARQSIIPPFTENMLKLILTDLVGGEDAFTLLVDRDALIVYIALGIAEEDIPFVFEMLRQIVPANMELVIEPK